MSKTIRAHNKFQYFLEDIECDYCLYYQKKSKHRKQGCCREICLYEEEKREAIAQGRIKREKGWNKWRE